MDKEPLTYEVLEAILDKEEFDVVECHTGKQAVHICISTNPDIILIDLELPDKDGHDVIRTVREWSHAPFIIVSARAADQYVIKGLEIGANDYVIKPFNANVLRARIYASLRRAARQEGGTSELFNGPLRINLVRHEVFLGDELIRLTPKEYSLLRFFMLHCGKMLSHRDILREVWGPAHCDNPQYLRVFIKQLREKLEKNPALPVIITTELGIGYRLEFFGDFPPGKEGGLQSELQ